MYIVKNALKCISRAKGRNILIGVIVFVIAVSSCIGLSIRQAAESAKKETLKTMSVTATISFDRSATMSDMKEEGESFDRSSFADKMGEMDSLSLEDYQTYAKADSVDDFYYTLTAYVNGNDDLKPVSSDSNTESDTSSQPSSDGPGGGEMEGKDDKIMGANSDFAVVGYSGESAMTSFVNGNATISDGAVFATGESNKECIITQELATYNGLSVGDTIKITNPNNEDETYKLKVVGIYTDSSANENSFSKFGSTSGDAANQIYVNYETLKKITDSSEKKASGSSDGETTAIMGQLNGTYVFSSVDSYEKFEKEAKALGLDDNYTVSSTDIMSFENSMVPLETLSKMAGYFLIVILIIGAIILVVLNIFNIRERKYEIGVLTAMGMKKRNVALQFLTEIFLVTLIAVVIGAGAGAVSSVPVTNALLENQVSAAQSQSEQVEQNFGRGGMDNNDAGQGGEKGGNRIMQMFGANSETSYVTQVSSAMNMTVVLQMAGIGLLLTLVAGMVSMLFVMRYEPLKILANRD
jgi:putative ABC transport system permease protein